MSDLGMTEADAVGHEDPYPERFLPHEGDQDDKAEKRKLGLCLLALHGLVSRCHRLSNFCAIPGDQVAQC